MDNEPQTKAEQSAFRVRSGVTGAEMAREMSALIISTFGAVKPTDDDRQALADALIAYSVRWVNDRFDLGIHSGNSIQSWGFRDVREALAAASATGGLVGDQCDHDTWTELLLELDRRSN